jgi:hypothetical protein
MAGGGPAELESACRSPPRLAASDCLPRRLLSQRPSTTAFFLRLHSKLHLLLLLFRPSSSLTSPTDPAHHSDIGLSLAQGAYAGREACQSLSWAMQWWASSAWVTWAGCTLGGSATQDGGRCKVFPESACTAVSATLMVRSTQSPNNHPLAS